MGHLLSIYNISIALQILDGKKYRSAEYALNSVALCLDDIHDLRNVLLAGVVVGGFYIL